MEVRECGDCYWRICGGIFDNKCGMNKAKSVEFDTPACSNFISDDTPACSSCAYYEFTTFNGRCKLKNIKIKGTVISPPACSLYVED